MQSILERFQFCLCNRKTEAAAFELLRTIFGQLPFEIYQTYVQTLMTVLLTRLQSKPSPRLQKDFVITMSLFVYKDPALSLPGVLGQVQAGLLPGLMTSVWLPALSMALTLDERKICSLALSKLMACSEVQGNAQLFTACCKALTNLLNLVPSATAPVAEGSDEENTPPGTGAGQEYEVSFSKLKNTDLPGGAAGMAPEVADQHAAVKALVLPHGQAIAQCVATAPDLQPLVTFLQR